MDLWVKNYMAACSGVEINYKASSSGEGIIAFNQGTVGFAGSDSALKPEEVADVEEDLQGRPGHQPARWSAARSPSATTSPGVDNLILDAPTLAKIFDGKIKKWNDPAIAKLNQGAKLPDKAIQAFHRSEDSGTTQNLGKYLERRRPGRLEVRGREEVAGPGRPGRVRLLRCRRPGQAGRRRDRLLRALLRHARSPSRPSNINTGAAAPVEATSENASKAIAAAKVEGTGKDLALEPRLHHQGRGRLPDRPGDLRDRLRQGQQGRHPAGTVKSFLTYTASDEGQKVLADAGYAPIPAEINAKVRETVAGLSLTRSRPAGGPHPGPRRPPHPVHRRQGSLPLPHHRPERPWLPPHP